MYILFGAGTYGESCLKIIGKDNIHYIVDNDEKKVGSINGVPIYLFSEKVEEIRNGEDKIIISVSPKYEDKIAKQLEAENITDYRKWSLIQSEFIRKKIETRPDYIGNHMRAIKWIQRNTVPGKGIINSSGLMSPYPEVSGYFIPSLIRWGYRDIAASYAKWLCSIQKQDGSWYDTSDTAPYVFDTAQILKGLIAIREILPEVDEHIRRGCEWMLTNMKPSGQLTTPTTEAWGDSRTCSELIHIYCLSPLRDAGKIFHEPRYAESAYKILCYYMETYRKEILHFSLLSHFYAYVMEGLLDMGAEGLARAAMKNMEKYQKEDGSVPAYHDVNWVCSTGLFQLALVWFRLGEIERGNKAFIYACKLQNESGGWNGSYAHPEYPSEDRHYFPNSEISWAVKYYLDALSYRNRANFARHAYQFLPSISRTDERYKIIQDNVKESSTSKTIKILDIGCGKGRYLHNLKEKFHQNKFYAVDLYMEMMELYLCEDIVIKKEGSLTDIPYMDDTFDVVYACESLEHSIDVKASIREMARVTKSCGKIIVIDKPKDKLGIMNIGTYEQWFDVDQLKNLMEKYCEHVEVVRDLSYDGNEIPGLFVAWIGTMK